MNLVEIFEWVKMGTIIAIILLCVFFSVPVFLGRGEYTDNVVLPWEKEERRAAKKAAKEKAREERRQAKRWREIEKQYR